MLLSFLLPSQLRAVGGLSLGTPVLAGEEGCPTQAAPHACWGGAVTQSRPQ